MAATICGGVTQCLKGRMRSQWKSCDLQPGPEDVRKYYPTGVAAPSPVNPFAPSSGGSHGSRSEAVGKAFASGGRARDEGRKRLLCPHVDADSGSACSRTSGDACT